MSDEDTCACGGRIFANTCAACGAMTPSADKSLEAAVKSGAMFYSPPDKMDEWVDDLMRPICESINKSEWVWTAESCAGHPEADEAGAWFHNTHPFIRLVTHKSNEGRVMELMFKAMHQVDKDMQENTRKYKELQLLESRMIEVIPSARPKPEWSELIIRLNAVNVYQRNQALEVWKQFAENVNE